MSLLVVLLGLHALAAHGCSRECGRHQPLDDGVFGCSLTPLCTRSALQVLYMTDPLDEYVMQVRNCCLIACVLMCWGDPGVPLLGPVRLVVKPCKRCVLAQPASVNGWPGVSAAH